jgi:PD-(D/E)XK nuclease superfamily protein
MAKLSNSAVESFLKCPVIYENRYMHGLVVDGPEPSYLAYGSRFHHLLMCHYFGQAVGAPPPDLSPALEDECQAMFEQYKAAYPIEAFTVVECEKPFEVPVGKHTLIGRIDMVVRDNYSQCLQLFETKTEKHGSKRNLPQAWIARHQGSLYTYAASQLYGEPIDTMLLNIATRSTPKGQVGPAFRRDMLHRTPQQLTEALKTFEWVADNVDRGVFVQATDTTCVNERGYECSYYSRCHRGDSSKLVAISPYGYLNV